MTKRKLIVEVELGDATDTECNACPWKREFGYAPGVRAVCVNEALIGTRSRVLPDHANARLSECTEAEQRASASTKAHAALIEIGRILDDGRERNEDCDRTLEHIEEAL